MIDLEGALLRARTDKRDQERSIKSLPHPLLQRNATRSLRPLLQGRRAALQYLSVGKPRHRPRPT